MAIAFPALVPAQEVEVVSIDNSNAQTSAATNRPFISGDGLSVVFETVGLLPSDTSGLTQVYLRDRDAGATELISVNNSGQVANAASNLPKNLGARGVTDDGQLVVFSSSATNLPDTGDNLAGTQHVYVRNRTTGQTLRVSQDDMGNPGNGTSGFQSEFAIAPNGWAVLFNSTANNLDMLDSDTAPNTYNHRLDDSSTRLACFDALGGKLNDCTMLTLSCQDLFAFRSFSSQAAPGDFYAGPDLFFGLSLAGFNVKITEDYQGGPAGTPGSQAVYSEPTISCDGQLIAFATTSDLSFSDQSDGNDREWDLYIHNNTADAGTSNVQRWVGGPWGASLGAQDVGMSSNGSWLTIRTPDSFDTSDSGFWDVYTMRFYRVGVISGPGTIQEPLLATLADAGGNGGTGLIDLFPTVANDAVTGFRSNSTTLLPPGDDTNGSTVDAFVTTGFVLFYDGFESGDTTSWSSTFP